MTKFCVDKDKCICCGTCITSCSSAVLKMSASDYPEFTDGGEQNCLRCGHCEAVCPENAVSLEFEGQSIPPTFINQDGEPSYNINITPDEFAKLAMMRRSVRKYKNKPVEREKIEEIIEIANYAASGCNLRPVKWIVITKRKEIDRVVDAVIDWAKEAIAAEPNNPMVRVMECFVGAREKGLDLICYNAPCLIAAYSRTESQGLIDSIIAMTHIDLAAPVFDLGTCWAGFVAIAAGYSPKVREALGIPSDCSLGYTMILGYPDIDFERIPKRPAADVVWK